MALDLFEESKEDIDNRKKATSYEKAYQECPWGMSSRAREGTTRGKVTLNSGNTSLLFEEASGQQLRIWDCALILSYYMDHAFPSLFWKDKTVLELGCGIGLPGLTAAKLGAKQVYLTDLSGLEWMEHHRKLNHLEKNQVKIEKLDWGHPHSFNGTSCDILLCSDLFYGDAKSAQLLLNTILTVGKKTAYLLMVHETRWQGHRNEMVLSEFQDAVEKCGYKKIPIEKKALHPVYQREFIDVVLWTK